MVCVAVLFLPLEMVEPDDFDWYGGMISFSWGHFVSSEEEAREIHEMVTEKFGQRWFDIPVPRLEKGYVRERSPGYYSLLALFYVVELQTVPTRLGELEHGLARSGSGPPPT